MESSASSTHKKLKEISTKRKNIYTIFDACQNVVDLVGREFRVIQKYYESEDGKKVFAEWKAKKENTDCASA